MMKILITDKKTSPCKDTMIANSFLVTIGKKTCVSENIFFRVIPQIDVRVISLNPSDNVTVEIDYEKDFSSFEDFLRLNLFDRRYIVSTFKIKDYYQVFDRTVLIEMRNYFNSLNVSEKRKLIRADEMIERFKKELEDREKTCKENEEKKEIKYIIGNIGYGFGDAVQRCNTFLKFAQSSSSKFTMVKHNKFSYKNLVHRSNVFNFYNFPMFSEIEDLSTEKSLNIITITVASFMEMIAMDPNFFSKWDEKFIMLVDLSTTPGAGLSRNATFNYYNSGIKREILKNNVKSFWNELLPIKKSIRKNQVIIHYRRGDYVTMVFNNQSNARTIHSTPSILKYLDNKLNKNGIEEGSSIDVIVISDHFDYEKIGRNHKKYIPVLFDYMGDENFKGNYKYIYNIRDKVIGTDCSSELKFIEYLQSSQYIIGNMSCLPVILADIMNLDIKNLSRDITANIRNTKDLDMLLNDKFQKTNSFQKYN